MGVFEAISAIIVTALSVALLIFIVKSLFAPLIGDPRGVSERWRFRRKKRLLKVLEQMISDGREAECNNHLRSAFYLEHIRLNPELIGQVSSHNFALLNVAITLGNSRGVQIDNLAIVEDLLNSRSQLMRNFLETIETKRELKSRRKLEGKSMPDWAEQEYIKKISELKDKLKTNRHSLISQIDQILKALINPASKGQATYH